ncbi:MAG: DNA translocase FtsK [Chloroflexi bacterium]|nr:DNA translocase FtsK [Chloroflexota bacterium]
MASSIGRKRRSTASPSIKELFNGSPRSLVDAVALMATALSIGLILSFSGSVRTWTADTLGYGWVPVGLFVAAVTAALRYNRRALFASWRHWILAATVAAMSIAVLSTISPSDGAFKDLSLGGRWGSVLGGTPVTLAALKILGMAVVVSLIIAPKKAGRFYLQVSEKLLGGVQLALICLYVIAHKMVMFLERRYRILRFAMRRQSSGGNLLKMLVRGPSNAPVRTRAYQESSRIESSQSIGRTQAAADLGFESLDILKPLPGEPGLDGPNLDSKDDDEWGMPESGLIPTWDSNAPAPPIESKPSRVKGEKGSWLLPSVDRLAPPDPHHAPEAALQEMARLVETTLGDHGVRVEVTDVKAGPRILRFGLVPGWVAKKGESGHSAIGLYKDGANPSSVERSRVKVQSILIREKDLALALKTPYLRIEAPVPGEALVGLEVPSPSPSKVHLREVMETPAFKKLAEKGGLPIALGQDTGGNPVVLDLAALPHMLIAGATGSGKSVCINSIVASFLLTKTPEQLRILMVDPKRVELTPFNGIPHLIGPVIVDAHEVNTSLRGLIREMLNRYKLMEESGTRNIEGYNKQAEDRMPFLVLIVDELADLMMVGGFDVEQNLVRLAQLGRATGIHLVLATQRPSVNVVTGLLKANIPARVAFAVSSQVDSRVILDAVGAEKLLGKGDMLLLHNESPKPSRVQGALVYDQEIDQMVESWLGQEGPAVPVIDVISPEIDENADGADARMMEEARELAARNPQLTRSYLERRLKIGGSKAEEVMETLEEEGFLDRD